MSDIDIYALFAIPRDANDEDIRSAFNREIKQWHPDVANVGNSTRAQELIEARAILLDPDKRKTYDLGINGVGLVRKAPTKAGKWIFVCSQGLGEFFTISEAIEKADDGDKIYVLPGIYRESLIKIEKRIEVVGQPSNGEDVVLEAPHDGVYVAGDGAILRSLVFNTTTAKTFGIITSCQNAATISNCRFTAPGATGIVVADGSILIEGCSFSSCLHGVRIDQAHAVILGSSFSSNGTGVLMRAGSDCIVENNDFTEHASAGIEIQADTDVAISRNRFVSGSAGIVLSGEARGLIEQNTFVRLNQLRSVLPVNTEITVALVNNRYEQSQSSEE